MVLASISCEASTDFGHSHDWCGSSAITCAGMGRKERVDGELWSELEDTCEQRRKECHALASENYELRASHEQLEERADQAEAPPPRTEEVGRSARVARSTLLLPPPPRAKRASQPFPGPGLRRLRRRPGFPNSLFPLPLRHLFYSGCDYHA